MLIGHLQTLKEKHGGGFSYCNGSNFTVMELSHSRVALVSYEGRFVWC